MFRRFGRLLVVLTCGWAGCASAAPITDTVTVNGEEWAQVDLFLGVDWGSINTVCPGGLCGNGTLNGYDMAGWSWATTDDLNDLFNHYIGFAALGPGPDAYFGDSGAVSDPFYADGWRITGDFLGGSKATAGFTADTPLIWTDFTAILVPYCTFFSCVDPKDVIHTDSYQDFSDFTGDQKGAWFKRSVAEVPSPATLPLLGLAVAVLLQTRKSGFNSRRSTTGAA